LFGPPPCEKRKNYDEQRAYDFDVQALVSYLQLVLKLFFSLLAHVLEKDS